MFLSPLLSGKTAAELGGYKTDPLGEYMPEKEISKTNNVLILNGATRINGNTDLILKNIFNSSANTAVKITQINLRKMKIADCIGCFQCQDGNRCSINDDMSQVREEINKSELLIFASPVYWWGVTGIMKIFIDRLFFYHSPFNKQLIAGKKAITIAPMNMNSDNHKTKILINFYEILFKNLDIELVDKYYFGNINEKAEICAKPEYLKQIDNLGKNLSNFQITH